MRRVTEGDAGTRIVMEDDTKGLHLFDLQTGREMGPRWDQPPRQSHFAIDPTHHFISGAFCENGVRIWDASTHVLIHNIPASAHPAASYVRAIAFMRDGTEFVTMMADGRLQRWTTTEGKPIGKMMERNESTVVLRWSADGRWISANGVNSVTVWNAQTGEKLSTIRAGSREYLTEEIFSPDSEKLLVSFGNQTIEPAVAQLYELPSLRPVGAPLRHGDGVAKAVFSTGGKLVATAGEDNVVRLWRVSDSRPVTGALRHNGIIGSVLFSPDDRLLATACVDGMVRLWSVDRGEMIAPPVQLGGSPRLFCFTPDGTGLFADIESGPTVWAIRLAPKEMPIEKLQILAECQTGLRADISMGAAPLSAAELATKFSTLAPGDTTMASAEELVRWHAESAAIAERRSEWFTAAFHLQRLTRKNPEDARLKERLQKALDGSRSSGK
jgi:WD40 repeat protein